MLLVFFLQGTSQKITLSLVFKMGPVNDVFFSQVCSFLALESKRFVGFFFRREIEVDSDMYHTYKYLRVPRDILGVFLKWMPT